jgi:hypothetical protein
MQVYTVQESGRLPCRGLSEGWICDSETRSAGRIRRLPGCCTGRTRGRSLRRHLLKIACFLCLGYTSSDIEERRKRISHFSKTLRTSQATQAILQVPAFRMQAPLELSRRSTGLRSLLAQPTRQEAFPRFCPSRRLPPSALVRHSIRNQSTRPSQDRTGMARGCAPGAYPPHLPARHRLPSPKPRQVCLFPFLLSPCRAHTPPAPVMRMTLEHAACDSC